MSRSGTDLLVNHSYNSLAQGVSEQTTEARHEAQVEQLENCIPHISRGILRRNPVNFVTTLKDKDGVDIVPEDYFVYSYDRGTIGEQYVFLLGNRKWYIYKIDGTLVGSYNDVHNIGTNLNYLDTNGLHPKSVFNLVTVGDHTWISNNQINTAMKTQTDGLSTAEHKQKSIYWVKSTGNTVTATNPSTGVATIEGYTYRVSLDYKDNTTAVTDSAVVKGSNTALTGEEIVTQLVVLMNGGRTSGSLEVITEGPFYNLPAGSTPYTAVTRTVAGAGSTIFTWEGTRIGVGSITDTSFVSGIYTYKIGTYVGVSQDYSCYTIYREHTQIIPGAPIEGLWVSEGPTMYRIDVPEESLFNYSDSFGNTASQALKGTVPSSDKLPATLPRGVGEVTINVIGSSEDTLGDSYWLRWTGDNWEESRAPGLQNIIDEATMPHTFIRSADGLFSFGFYGDFTGNLEADLSYERPGSSKWVDRLKGDLDSTPDPSFIGKNINDMFVHNNRLGFLAEDSIVLSELSVYGNFFPTTVRSIPDTDPIDLIVATTDVTGLKKAVSLSGILLLFSDEAQFSLTGSGGALTPSSATINSVSKYNYSNKASARVLGNKVMFTTESGNGTQLFNFITENLSGGASNIVADNISLHVPTYLPNNINYITSHSILGYLFMLSPDEPNTIFVLNTLDIGKQSVQSAFHKWTFDAAVEGISVLDNSLLMLMNKGGKLIGTTISLDVPVVVSDVEYRDELAVSTYTNYQSYVTLSKWFLKDAEGYGNKRGRLQIRTALFSTGNLDKYKVEIFNDSIINVVPTDENWILTEAVWDDTAYWSYSATNTDDSIVIWKDALPFFSRVYYNDKQITVTSNSDNTFIRFGSNELEPTKGFSLSTVNMEGLFRQRSTRT